MAVPRSQKMSFRGIAGWSLLCGMVLMLCAAITGVVVHWSNEYAFKDLTVDKLVIVLAGIFLLGTLIPMAFLLKVNWVEEEGPAEIAEEIERK